MKDSIKVNSKGCVKIVKHDGVKNYKYSQCFQSGHTKRTCPLYPSKYVQPNDLTCIVGGISCVSNDIQSRPSSYNMLTPTVSMASAPPGSPGFMFKTTCPWRHNISEGINGHYDNSNAFCITFETYASTYYNWLAHNNL